MQKDVAEAVARHLVAAGTLVDEDPEAALAHARYARRRASRIAVVREAAGITAYHAGEWAEALAELRAARRMGGGPGHLAVMADVERAMGRPERAIELSRSPEARELDRNAQIELAIVVAGARRDLDEIDAAVVALQVPELEASRRDPWSARLFYAYADNLLAAGRESDALQWFVHAADADTNGETDADARIADLTGEPLADDGIEFALDDEVPGDDPAAETLDDGLGVDSSGDDRAAESRGDGLAAETRGDDPVAETRGEDLVARTRGEDLVARTRGEDLVAQTRGDDDLTAETRGDHPVAESSGDDLAVETGGSDPAVEIRGSDPAVETGGSDPAVETGGSDPAASPTLDATQHPAPQAADVATAEGADGAAGRPPVASSGTAVDEVRDAAAPAEPTAAGNTPVSAAEHAVGESGSGADEAEDQPDRAPATNGHVDAADPGSTPSNGSPRSDAAVAARGEADPR